MDEDEDEDFYLTNEEEEEGDRVEGKEIIEGEEDFEDIYQLKRKAAAFLTDLYQQQNNNTLEQEDVIIEDDNVYVGKKRTFHQSNAVDLFTQSAVKKLALATNMMQPTCFSDEDFLAHAGVLLASAHSSKYL